MLLEEVYQRLYKQSIEDPVAYWEERAADVHWYKKWDSVYDPEEPVNPKWFRGGQLNVCYNCLDRHVANGKSDQVIIYHRSALTKKDRHITYGYLLTEVSKLAAVLANCGVTKGDTVVIYMPNIPEGVIAMLACARLGAVHCVLFGGLTPNDLALRIEHCEPKAVISSVAGMFRSEVLNYKERIESAMLLSNWKPEKCVFFRGEQKSLKLTDLTRDLIWEEVIDKFGTHDCVPVESEHPMFCAYTSGTTGNPKGVVVECGPTVVRYIAEMRLLDMAVGVGLASSELGWILGHGMYCYLPLLNCVGTVVYEGDLSAESDTMYKLIQDFKVNYYVGSYSTIRNVKSMDPQGLIAAKHDLSSMIHVMIGAECPDISTIEFANKVFGAPVMNMYGQTEANMTLAAYYSNEQVETERILLQPRPSPGVKLVSIKDDGTEAERGEVGKLMVKLPMIPGFAVTLLKRHEFFKQDYFQQFPGYYDTKDEGIVHEDGSLSIVGRSDDVINVGPYRVAGSNVEEVILAHPDVIECVVVGVPDTMKGEVPLALFVRRKESKISVDKLTKEVNDLVLEKLGKSIFFRGAVCVRELPKTMTGKIQRKPIRELLHGKLQTASSPQHSILEDILRLVKSSGTISA